ncbi:MAG: YbhN family protein [Bacteroidales bacterium]
MKDQKGDNEKVLKSLKPSRIIYPIIIGLLVSSYLLIKQLSSGAETFSFFHWTYQAVFYFIIAIAMMVVRDLAYMYRVRVLTNGFLSWKKSFDIIMLWEFSSAISPSVVGGTAPAIYFFYKEGLNGGKSTAVVLTAIFLDELFFIIMVPLMYLFFGWKVFPSQEGLIMSNISTYFLVGYFVIFVYTLFLAYALFINPYTFKSFLSWIFLFPLIRRWRLNVRKSANQLITTSKELKGRSFAFWLKAFISTCLSWTGRYWVVNFLFMAFFADRLGFFENFLIYARQLTMWIILLVSPTPGGSGIAEIFFSDFLGDFIPNLAWAIPLALLWRLISYYPYLFIGSIILPRWVKRVYKIKS